MRLTSAASRCASHRQRRPRPTAPTWRWLSRLHLLLDRVLQQRGDELVDFGVGGLDEDFVAVVADLDAELLQVGGGELRERLLDGLARGGGEHVGLLVEVLEDERDDAIIVLPGERAGAFAVADLDAEEDLRARLIEQLRVLLDDAVERRVSLGGLVYGIADAEQMLALRLLDLIAEGAHAIGELGARVGEVLRLQFNQVKQ